jgi:HD-like signal output (HDOD) protein/AmiR/NasT family two-component response regulator
MTRILFVDDEPMMLRSLKRMLLPQADQWRMSFAEGGKEALEVLEEGDVDIIVTDIRMPGLDGVQLLERVKEYYPHINRIVLSGHADDEMALKTTRLAHQYVAKPCDAGQLIEVLDRSAQLLSILDTRGVKEALAKIESLPSPPEQVQAIMELVRDESSSLKDIGRLIAGDMGMTSNILKLINSAFFGLPRRVSEITEAVVLLGMDIIKALVMTHYLFTTFEFKRMSSFSFELLWNHCLNTACMSRRITKSLTSDKTTIDDSFISGVLHDVGKLVLGFAYTEEYKGIILEARQNNQCVWKIESARLGFSHAEIGAYLIGLWGLPTKVLKAVQFHHEPANLTDPEDILTTAVHLADVMEHQLNVIHQNYDQPGFDLEFIAAQGLEGNLGEWMGEFKRNHESNEGG